MKINLSLFTNILALCKTLHWSTRNYGFHMSLDQAFEDFVKALDEYVEVALGIYGRDTIIATQITNKIVPDENLQEFISDELVAFNNELTKITGSFSQLKSVEDSIRAIENQLIYRLGLH